MKVPDMRFATTHMQGTRDSQACQLSLPIKPWAARRSQNRDIQERPRYLFSRQQRVQTACTARCPCCARYWKHHIAPAGRPRQPARAHRRNSQPQAPAPGRWGKASPRNHAPPVDAGSTPAAAATPVAGRPTADRLSAPSGTPPAAWMTPGRRTTERSAGAH